VNPSNSTGVNNFLAEYSNLIILGIQILFFILPLIVFLYYMRMMGVRTRNQQKELAKRMQMIPPITWDQIYDMREVKQRLEEISNYVMNKRRAYGVILFGPPGTGKTSVAKALANKLKWNYFELRAQDVLSKWYGESEYLLNNFFDTVELF